MENLRIAATKSTPEIQFNPTTGLLCISGQSYPENAYKFYEPLLNWLEEYLSTVVENTTVLIDLHLPYINTSSTKCFMMLLDKLDQAYIAGKKIEIQWRYNVDNDSELECAEEFKEDLSIPFQIIPKEDSQ